MMLLWTGFIALILLLLALDLGIFHRAAHVVTVKEALKWSVVWVTVGLSFSIPIYFAYENHWFDLGTTVDAIDDTVNDGRAAAGKYLTGYIVEQSLSVDNLFVIAMIFSAFAVPAIYQHRLLFWGIIGALAMRGAMIGIGAQLVSSFHWILYLFGAFLIVTSVKMLATKSAHAVPSNGAIIRIARRFFPVTDRYHGNHFLVRAGSANSKEGTPGIAVPFEDAAVARAKPGAWMLTPLAIALLTIETTDLIFAVDSIPAILRSRQIHSWSSAATSLQFLDCGHFSSCLPECSTNFATSNIRSLRFCFSSAPRCSSRIGSSPSSATNSTFICL